LVKSDSPTFCLTISPILRFIAKMAKRLAAFV
jgi:hypothetical protein